jgi:glycosyltransferase involved in cell wall biosynthesis
VKILHCPSSVIGHAWGLSRGERRLGFYSDVMYFKGHPFGYEADINLHLERNSWPARVGKAGRFAWQALKTYDVFHFNFGASLLSTFYIPFALDIPLIASRGKKIFATFMGCDARMREYTRTQYPYSACSPEHCKNGWCNPVTDRLRKRRIEVFSKWGKALFCLNPDLCRFVPNAVFLPYAHVDLQKWTPIEKRKENRAKAITVLHAPSDRNIKGTRYVLDAVGRLQAKGFPVKLDIIENAGHQEVKERILHADIVIDQMLVGWYGGFAVEAMALAKPVISYIRKEDLKFIPNEMSEEIPIVSATVGSLEEDLANLIVDSRQMRILGEKGRAYVEKWHDPLKVAQITLRYYEGKSAGLSAKTES